ncbi:hypothetical protein DM02DRAFT_211373 [Periconia macrospinosa]|uniref:Uncharacterized protein n=1 Tax=Periconia macrospinosa TaxID=97972 RepID=A0A2V1D8J8_9PLEO|nr:hypothetical protein DM02DRAFT_211373 [Periconia macrospinosa]
MSPPPPPRQARLQDGVSTGPLRRRVTSPASSIVETSMENAAGSLPSSPKKETDKSHQITPPKPRLQSPALLEESKGKESPPAPDGLPPSSESTSHPLQDSQVSESSEVSGGVQDVDHDAEDHDSPSRGIWRWANVGTSTFGIIKRLPHPEWKGPLITSRSATSAVNGALEEGKSVESLDDFSIPSSILTEPDNAEGKKEAVASKTEGLGVASSIIDPSFSQTKRSSDDLVAAMSTQGTPSPQAHKSEQWTDGDDSMISNVSIPPSNGSPPATPSPPQRQSTSATPALATPATASKDTPSPHRIPKYKIALSKNILSQHTASPS